MRLSSSAALAFRCSKESHIPIAWCSEIKPLQMPTLKMQISDSPLPRAEMDQVSQRTFSASHETSQQSFTLLKQRCDNFPNALSRAFMFIQIAFSQGKEEAPYRPSTK